MRITSVQFDIVWEDKDASHAEVERLLEASPPGQGDLVVLPELGDVGFSLALDRIVDERSALWAQQLAARYQCWLLHGWPERRGETGRNVAGLVAPDGTLRGTAEKLHPFTAGHEHRAYEGGDGPFVFDVDGVAVCPLICYDLRFPEAFRVAAAAGAEVFIVIANWPKSRSHHWRALSIARAIENQAALVACNRTGSDPHMVYFGGSLAVDHTGIVLAEGSDVPSTVTAEFDIAALRKWRNEFPALKDMRADLMPSKPAE